MAARTPVKQKPKQLALQPENMGNDVTNAVTVDPVSPIPLELENIFGFSIGGSKYIPFFAGNSPYYGNNNFFINILRWRNESPTLNACITSKVNYFIGDGLAYDSEDKANKATFDKYAQRCNSVPQGLTQLSKIAVDNFFTFGNTIIEFVRGTAGGTKFLYIYIKNTLDCRKSWPNSYGESEGVVISRAFRDLGTWNLTEKFNIQIPFYKLGKPLDKNYWLADSLDNQGQPTGSTVFRSALWIKNDYPGYDHYGLPSWLPSMRSALLEGAGAQFNLDNIANNMVVGGLLVVAGNVDEPAVRKIQRMVDKHTGKGKTGRTLVIGAEEGIVDSKFQSFDTHKEGSYIELERAATDKIILANEWDGAFIGKVESSGSKSKSGAYLNELYQQKIKTVIKPAQRKFKDEFIAPLCDIANAWFGYKWDAEKIDWQISNLFDDTTEASTTVNGGDLFLKVVSLIGSGVWDNEGAINFIVSKFGMSEEDARNMVGKIKVVQQQTDTKSVNTNV
jgi:hypothetical protein